jgi:guanylate kinase
MADPTPRPLLIVLSAPSGGGKTTLCERLLAANASLERAVTCTTRPPRPGEKDGVHYYFLEAGTFLKRVQAGHFLEHATVYGNSYGTLKSEVLSKMRQGKDVILSVDVQGAASIKAETADEPDLRQSVITVFLTPKSVRVLEERLRRRGQDSEPAIRTRLSVARQEVGQWRNFDYLILSTSPEADFRRMQAVLEAERMRTARAECPWAEG